MVDMSQQVLTVVPGSLVADKSVVVELWQDGLRHPDPGKSFEWLYINNPVKSGSIYLLKSRHVDEAEQNAKSVGTIGTSPRRLKLRGEEISAALFSDFVVTPAYRSLGPALKLVKESVASMIVSGATVYGFPNHRASAVLRRTGFEIVGEFARYAKVLRTKEKIAERIPSVLAPVGSFFLDIALWVDDFITSQAFRTALGEVEWLSDFDKRFDELAESSTMGVICNYRGSSFLRWRFCEGAVTDYKVFAITMPGDRSISGYAVFRIEGDIAHIDDFYARDGEGVAHAVFSRFMLELRKFPVSSVSMEVLAYPSFKAMLHRLRFQKREARHLFVATANESMKSELDNPDLFYLTSSDEDQ